MHVWHIYTHLNNYYEQKITFRRGVQLGKKVKPVSRQITKEGNEGLSQKDEEDPIQQTQETSLALELRNYLSLSQGRLSRSSTEQGLLDQSLC